MSGFIFNPPTIEENYRHQIGPRPTAIVLQHTQDSQHRSRSRSRSKSPGRVTRNDTLRRQYSTSRLERHPSSPDRFRPSTDRATADIRRQYSTLRTTSPGPLPRGRSAGPRNAEIPHKPTEDEIVYEQPNYPAPFLSTVKFHRPGLEESERFRNLHKARLARRAYLRHSFNRMDFIAVVSYWIALVLELTGVMTEHHIYLFQMLSCLRIFRLLGITEGTSVCPA